MAGMPPCRREQAKVMMIMTTPYAQDHHNMTIIQSPSQQHACAVPCRKEQAKMAGMPAQCPAERQKGNNCLRSALPKGASQSDDDNDDTIC